MRALLTAFLMLTTLAAAAAETSPAASPAAAPAEQAKPLLRWNLGRAMGPAPEAVLLAPVEVTGHRDAFREADQRLKKAAEALPCVGCGGSAKEKVGVVEKVLTGAADVLKSQFVADEHAADPDSIEDRAQQEAGDRRFIRAGQDP
ncbi:MAG: hypothetical protein Q8Q73_16295 [Stagnimonas sp.]|nr:hypothetical protein [Stagnimonas sp.]